MELRLCSRPLSSRPSASLEVPSSLQQPLPECLFCYKQHKKHTRRREEDVITASCCSRKRWIFTVKSCHSFLQAGAIRPASKDLIFPTLASFRHNSSSSNNNHHHHHRHNSDNRSNSCNDSSTSSWGYPISLSLSTLFFCTGP